MSGARCAHELCIQFVNTALGYVMIYRASPGTSSEVFPMIPLHHLVRSLTFSLHSYHFLECKLPVVSVPAHIFGAFTAIWGEIANTSFDHNKEVMKLLFFYWKSSKVTNEILLVNFKKTLTFRYLLRTSPDLSRLFLNLTAALNCGPERISWGRDRLQATQ